MKVGFICEGKTERKIVESDNFQQILNGLGIECVFPVIDAEGNGNLLPEYLPEYSELLHTNGAERIVVLTDLDADACITFTKQRINAPANHFVIVSKKQIESWFLADDVCMSAICGQSIHFELPENEPAPFETIRQIFLTHTGRGVGDKILLAAKMLRNNFSVLNAAAHPNCKSAKYFVEKLKSLV
jgi:hypothetical protein